MDDMRDKMAKMRKTVEVVLGRTVVGVFSSEAKARAYQKELFDRSGLTAKLCITLGEAPGEEKRMVEIPKRKAPRKASDDSCREIRTWAYAELREAGGKLEVRYGVCTCDNGVIEDSVVRVFRDVDSADWTNTHGSGFTLMLGMNGSTMELTRLKEIRDARGKGDAPGATGRPSSVP